MNLDYDDLSEFFKALAHPVRLQILDMLRNGEICVCHIETAIQKRQAYISQQLMTLREAGLVESRRDGLQVYYRLRDERVSQLLGLTLGTNLSGHIRYDMCPCPTCVVILAHEIQ